MTRERLQVFFESPEIREINRLCKRYGWTASQVMERVLKFYLMVEREMADIVIYYEDAENIDDDNPMQWPVVAVEHEGEVFDCENTYMDYVNLIRKLQEGLTPVDGFDPDDEEGV